MMASTSSFTFYLDWVVSAQFAGIFWAKENGLYGAKGLDVTIVPWHDDGGSVIEMVLDAASNGELCAGCAEDNLVVSRCAADGSVQVFGAMLQETPLVVMSRPSQFIRTVSDLRGRRVGMHADGIRALELVLALEGIPTSDLDLVEVGFDLDHLRLDRFDALQGYTMTEPVQLAALGLEVDVTPVKHRKLKPYAQTYFSESKLLAGRHEQFADFLTASSAGWLAVCARPDEAAAVVSQLMHGPSQDVEQRRVQRRSLERLIPLVAGHLPVEQMGSVEIGQWKRNLDTYFEFDLIGRRLTTDDLVFELGRRSA
jgi:NitT/TauT family transport system substrate-binding protein